MTRWTNAGLGPGGRERKAFRMVRALARLKEHWVRHLLAALQVAVGVAVVTALFLDVLPLLRTGTSSHEATTYSVAYGGQSSGGYFRSSVFTTQDVDYLMNEAHTVTAASIYQDTSG